MHFDITSFVIKSFVIYFFLFLSVKYRKKFFQIWFFKNNGAAACWLAGEYPGPAEAAESNRGGALPGHPPAPGQAGGAEQPTAAGLRHPHHQPREAEGGEGAAGGLTAGQDSRHPGGRQPHHTRAPDEDVLPTGGAHRVAQVEKT